MRVYTIEDKTAVVVFASYRSVSRNPVLFKALELPHRCDCTGASATLHSNSKLLSQDNVALGQVQHHRSDHYELI